MHMGCPRCMQFCTYCTVLRIQFELTPLSKLTKLYDHPDEVFGSKTIMQHFLICHNAYRLLYHIIPCAVVLRGLKLAAGSRDYLSQNITLSYSFLYTSQICLHETTYLVKIIITCSVTHCSIRIWTDFVTLNLN